MIPAMPNTVYQNALERGNNCLVYMRQLRERILKMHREIRFYSGTDQEPKHLQEFYVRKSKEINSDYEKLEKGIKLMPDRLPQFDQLNRMKLVYQDEDMDKNQATEVESLVNAQNWNESTFQYMSYAAEFLRMWSSRKRPSILERRPLSFSSMDAHSTTHLLFDRAVSQTQKEFQMKKAGIWITVVERSIMGSILEVKFGTMVDKLPVVNMRLLITENNGVMEKVVIIAPHEKWKTRDCAGKLQYDVEQCSRYQVFQRMTQSANLLLLNYAYPASVQLFQSLLLTFSRYHFVFELTCCVCKKHVKDFLPCLNFDCRNPKSGWAPYHDSCIMNK